MPPPFDEPLNWVRADTVLLTALLTRSCSCPGGEGSGSPEELGSNVRGPYSSLTRQVGFDKFGISI